MEKREYLIILYDFYSELLSDKQKEHFEDYYFNNLYTYPLFYLNTVSIYY